MRRFIKQNFKEISEDSVIMRMLRIIQRKELIYKSTGQGWLYAVTAVPWGLCHTGLAFWTLQMWGGQSPLYQQLPRESCGDSRGKQTPGYWLSLPCPRETLPPLLTGSAHVARAAKAGGTEGRHLGKRADVPTKGNSWKNESPFYLFYQNTHFYVLLPLHVMNQLRNWWCNEDRRAERRKEPESLIMPLSPWEPPSWISC